MLYVMQIVNGGQLPTNVIHEPVSLFDQHGQYIGENVAAGGGTEADVSVSTVQTAPADAEVHCVSSDL